MNSFTMVGNLAHAPELLIDDGYGAPGKVKREALNARKARKAGHTGATPHSASEP